MTRIKYEAGQKYQLATQELTQCTSMLFPNSSQMAEDKRNVCFLVAYIGP